MKKIICPFFPFFFFLLFHCSPACPDIDDEYFLWCYKTGVWVHSNPSFADIDNDGKLEVVFGSDKIFALNGEDGSLLWSYNEPTASSPSIGDIDNDGKLEVVVGSHNKIYALNGEDGSLLWYYEAEIEELNTATYTSPPIGDIDNDEKLEVVAHSGKKIYALNGEDGSLLWSYETGDTIWNSPSLGDIDNDGKLEVIIGSGKKIYALNGEDGSLLWSYETGDLVKSSPSLGDIDNDGKLEVVVGTEYGEIYALNGEDGSLLWRYDARGASYAGSLPIGDIDNDGKLEVVIADCEIYALNGDGSLLWKFLRESPESPCVGAPSLGDIDNDGRLEIVGGGGYNKIYAFNGEDGSLSWSYKKIGAKTGESWLYVPSLGDINNDGKLDIVASSRDSRVFAVSTNSPVPPPHLLPWPKFKHDVKNTGLYTGDPYPPW
jgi:outer membrane protein assembly factor BamB